MNRTLKIVGLAVLILAGVYSVRRTTLEPVCGVVIAARDLPTGHLITLEDVRELSVTCSVLPVGTFLQRADQAAGMTTLRPIPKLEFITVRDFRDGTADGAP
jgi:flagella basal body P-ring formation protein FlgA